MREVKEPKLGALPNPSEMLTVSGMLGVMEGAGTGGAFATDAATMPSRMRCIEACCWLISWMRRASWSGLVAGG